MNDTTRRCEEVLCLLEQEVGLHRDLLELSRREQGLLVTLDADLLIATLNDVEKLVARIRSVMQARLGLLAELAGELSSGPDRGRLASEDVLSLSGGRDRGRRYRDLLQCLRPILEEHSAINAGNMILINNILDYMDFAAGVLASRSGRNTYEPRKVGRRHALSVPRP